MLNRAAEIQANAERAKNNAMYIASVADMSDPRESGRFHESATAAGEALTAMRVGDLELSGRCAADTAYALDYFVRKRLESFGNQHWPVRTYRLHGRS